MPPVYHDRLLALGFTGSGKSEFLNVAFSELRVQRLLADSKHEFEVIDLAAEPDPETGERPVLTPARDPSEIDWTQPVIHYRDSTGTAAEFNELFERCFRRRRLVVCVHELADICEESPGRTPRHFSGYCAKGRALGLGLLAGSQRPVNMPKRALTEANHIVLFVPALSPSDHDLVAAQMGLSRNELRTIINRAHERFGDFTYLQFDKAARGPERLVVRPPLPEHVRRKNIVRRTSVV